MKIVKIIGGLGNQMFQFAFACKLKHLFPEEKVLIDLSHFKGYGLRNYELDYVFDIRMPIASFFQLCQITVPYSIYSKKVRIINNLVGRVMNRNIYRESCDDYYSYNPEPFKIKKSQYYDGYWFNEAYFLDIQDEIRNIFTFKRPLSIKNEILHHQIDKTNSVGIHVRRGDYLLYDEYKGICDKDYYIRAINYMKTQLFNPHFYIFSNDLQWCKDNLTDYMDNYTFSENNDSQYNYVDMQLMSYCKHNIIAHSSFSWWAAWLNNNEDKIVVAPSKWNNNNANKPQLRSWVLMD